MSADEFSNIAAHGERPAGTKVLVELSAPGIRVVHACSHCDGSNRDRH